MPVSHTRLQGPSPLSTAEDDADKTLWNPWGTAIWNPRGRNAFEDDKEVAKMRRREPRMFFGSVRSQKAATSRI